MGLKLDTKCFGPNGMFIAYSESRKWLHLRLLLFSIAKILGIPDVNSTVCGEPPPNTVWIMDRSKLEHESNAQWSSCTIKSMKEKRKELACLRRRVKPIKPMCGNGYVENDEQCDCITKSCRKCCDDKCMLTKGSVCSNGPCCDKSTCQFVNSATQCRAANDFCDIPELCDGKSEDCPPNVVVANGYECRKTPYTSYCYNGKCGSRQNICGWAFKDGSIADADCYDYNLEGGTEYGGCGPTFQSRRVGISYSACKPKDKFCGKVYCTQLGIQNTSKLEYTQESSDFFTSELQTLT